MRTTRRRGGATAAVAALVLLAGCADSPAAEPSEEAMIPTFEADPDWPRPLPNGWTLGPVTGLSVDARDHVWVVHAPGGRGPEAEGAVFAPKLIELDAEGNFVQGWDDGEGYTLSDVPHGIFVDHQGNVWVTARTTHQLLKFSGDGRHLLTVGELNVTGGSNDPERLGRPAGVWVDPGTNEVFVADGYQNRRVVVYDGETGAYLRHWGAYGRPPVDPAPGERRRGEDVPVEEARAQFSTVHGIAGSSDGLIYVADRANSRVQVFRQDGSFVAEQFVDDAPEGGTAFNVAFSGDPEQRFLYLEDGSNHLVWVLRRADLEVLGSFGGEGSGPGQLLRPHAMDADSKGNLIVGEADNRRLQRFRLTGMAPATTAPSDGS